MKELGIEAKLEKLMGWMRAVHNRLDTHEWVKVYMPWNSVAEKHGKKGCKPPCSPDAHLVYGIRCDCGEQRPASREQYDATEHEYDGY